MANLINAGFARMFKSRAFRFSAIFLIVISIINCFCNSALTLEEGVLTTIPVTMIVMSVFIARFVAAEYEANAIRNKIIVGKSKRDIYLSNFIVCSAGSLILCLVSMVTACAVLLIYGVASGCAVNITLSCLAGSVFAIVSLSAILCALSLINSKTALNAVICMLLVIGLLVAGEVIDERLREPDTMIVMYDDEEFWTLNSPLEQSVYFEEHAVTEPNPYYLSGTKRRVYEFLQNVNPVTQSIVVFGNSVIPDEDGNLPETNVLRLIPYSIMLTAAATAFGVLVFARKDIK